MPVDAVLAPLDRDNAYDALQLAAADLDLDVSRASLVRLGSNAVFRLNAQPVIARVGRTEAELPTARREIAVARWLASVKVPAVVALDMEQPITAAGRVITFWESASDREEYGNTVELAGLLRSLHSLSAPDHLDLPTLSPFDRATDRVERSEGLSTGDRDFLIEKGAGLEDRYSHLSFQLPTGVIHGDANVGNVFRDRNGKALFGDLDGFAFGPREWDLVQTAMFYDRFTWHSEEEYRAFSSSYGFDILTWSGYEVLAETREFLMTTWLAQNVEGNSDANAEFHKRLRTLRTGASRKDWAPF